MAYGKWKIEEELTFNEYGYYSNSLTKGSKKPVKCKCEACGVIANKRFRESNAKHICKSIIDGKKKCFKCKLFKPTDTFSKNRNSTDGFSKLCKECYSNYDCVKNGYNKKSSNLKTNLKEYLKYKHNYFKYKSKMKNIDFDLESNTLYELYETQNGKCYYTGIDIIHNLGCSNYNSISVERLEPSMGYTKDNIVLAAFNINSLKGMMSENEFKLFLDRIIPNLIKYKNKKR
jgi:hypothetical protein